MAKQRFDYFDAFNRQAELGCEISRKLHEVFRDFTPDPVLDQLNQMHEIENAADEINHDILKHLATEFITPIDREDIANIAHLLDNIIDYIEDVCQRLYIFNISYVPRDAVEMVVLIEKSCDALNAVLKDFRNFKKSKTLGQLLINVNDYEEEADKLFLGAVRDLYVNHTDDPLYVLAWNNIYSRMEKCADACESAAAVIGTIILKNS
jgi:predicted phosphate transport protein (TIGR00153 family)